MGLVLTVPLIIIVNIIRKYYFFKNDHSTFSSYLKQQWTATLIRFLQFWQKERLNNYSLNMKDPIDKIGLVPSKAQKELEYPVQSHSLQYGAIDEVSMSGFNAKGDALLLRLLRKSDHRTEVFLLLYLQGRGMFHLPFLPDCRAYSSDAKGFNSRGLKIRCLSAMTKWRISYNGFLKKMDVDEEEMVHVKFSFIWTTLSKSHDFQNDYNSSLLANSIYRHCSFFPYNIFKKYRKTFNSYEQWGQYVGTLSLNNVEEEMYLWGPRHRDRGVFEWKRVEDYNKIYCYFLDGTVFHMGNLNIPGTFTNLKYGYVIQPNQFLHPIESCDLDTITNNEKTAFNLKFQAGGKYYEVDCEQLNENCEVLYGENAEIRSTFHLANFTLDKVKGKGYVEFGSKNNICKLPPLKFKYPCLLEEHVVVNNEMPFVVAIHEELCQNENVSGGKGSSLAKLCKLLNMQKKELYSDANDIIVVPRGIVITTSAFMSHVIVNNLSSKILSFNSSKNRTKLEKSCKILRDEFTKTVLTENIKRSILEKLEEIFSKDLDNIAFAVRSSATGEDSLESSAAGQMDTFLGIRSVDKIFEHVVKCWSSQFSFIAVNYKRQMGQSLDNAMAVVVQEMIPAQVAGVAFTCDPVTGNPGYITITANYGLGESVVSATCEPDTIVLKRNIDNTLCLESQTIGEKRVKIKMTEVGGTVSENVAEEEAKLCCLSTEQALKIGNVAVLIEECFGNARDIEWAIFNNGIYLLQARPITTQDLETDFELIHELDSGLLTDSEYITKANVGEILPNANSPLTISSIYKALAIHGRLWIHKQEGPQLNLYNPQVPLLVAFNFNHAFIMIIDFIMRKCSKEVNVTSYGWQISFFGRVLDNFKELHQIALRRFGIYPTFYNIRELFFLVLDALRVGKRLRNVSKVMNKRYIPENMNFSSSQQLYSLIGEKLLELHEPSALHLTCSSTSSVCNISVFNILSKIEGSINDKLFVDFSNLISDCGPVESVDIPNSLKKLAKEITNCGERENFIEMKPEEAVEWLDQENNYLGQKFKEFIKQHGHRGVMEYDVMYPTWSLDPTQLIKSLQATLKGLNKGVTEDKKHVSPSEAVEKLGLPIGWISKYMLKIMVKLARIFVCRREEGKSLMMKSIDVCRRGYIKLGEMMENEGRIPDSNLIFFFTHEEIGDLLNSRSAHLISKAMRRRKLHKTICNLRFEEIICGIPKPIQVTETSHITSDWVINGIPVRQGIVTATARVIQTLAEGRNLQSGDILVTYSTDIGWSPYFPLLSGIVTELGGLLSHGAVVAREFGIPCIVGARGATAIVKSGDIVTLNGNLGTLKKA